MTRKECMKKNSFFSELKSQGFLSDCFALKKVLRDAIEQAESGKGRERHAEEGEPFERQIICEVTRRLGFGYPLGQAVKKIYESQRLIPQLGVQELLGAINYIAAAVIVMREGLETAPKAESGCFQNGNNQPEFKPGDRVQFKEHLGVKRWADARYEREHPSGCGHIVYAEGFGRIAVEPENLRPAPKAEGCEELAQKDEAFDAPQTKEELMQRIVDCNPATFHTPSYAEEQLEHHSRLQPRTPTGEELAEMAEEVTHG